MKELIFLRIGVAVVLLPALPGTLDAALITNITISGTGQGGAYGLVNSVADGGPGLQNGSLAFMDRSYPWTGPGDGPIADYLLGLEYLRSRNDDKSVADLAVEVTFGDFARVYLFDRTPVSVAVTGAVFTDMGTTQIALDHGSTYGIITYSLRQAVVAPNDTITIGRDSSLMWGLAVAPRPSVLHWEGDAGTGWNDGTMASNTNWTDGTAAPGDQVKPMSGNDLVFTRAGTYSGNLSLGGATFELNSITIGQAGNTADGGPSDFGVTNRILASDGLIRLGAGGLTATMVGTTAADAARNVTINADIELTADATIRRNTAFGSGNRNRSLYFGGVISGGSVGNPLNLVISSAGTGSANQAIVFQQANTFVANVDLNGVLVVTNPAGLGHPSNTYTLNQGVYLQMNSSGALMTEYDFVLAPGASSVTRIARLGGGSWTFNGNVTGGHPDKALEILTNGNDRQIIFAGAEQSFSSKVELWGGSKVIIAAADPSGVAWPNAGRVLLNRSNLSAGLTTDLLLRGDFTLNQDIEVANITNNNRVHLGQINDGAAPFDAIFNGRINVLEPDLEVLHLTAGDGGSATFTGEINVVNNLGFRKIGQGTVAVAGRVSQGQGTTTPLGTVTVEQGTLLVNSPGGNDSFFTTGIDVHSGATLGGTGHIVGGVALAGSLADPATLAPGSDAGPLLISGDVDFGDYGVLAAAFGANGDNRLEVDGLLDLSGANNQLVVTGWFPGDVGLIASYGSLEGEFNVVDLSALGPRFQLVYNYLGQNQIAIIPEPGSLLLLMAGVLALLPLRSRRKHA